MKSIPIPKAVFRIWITIYGFLEGPRPSVSRTSVGGGSHLDDQALADAGPSSVLFLHILFQGPEPEQADSAVHDLAARPAAPHLQHTQVSSDRQGDVDRRHRGLVGAAQGQESQNRTERGGSAPRQAQLVWLRQWQSFNSVFFFSFGRVFFICEFKKILYI